MDTLTPSLFRPSVYLRPRGTQEAVAMLERHGGKASVLAGGTDVLAERDPAVAALVDISALGLCYIRGDSDTTRLGAATTLAVAARSESLAAPGLVALREAAAAMATPQIRNVATLGGNLCTASPGADLAPPLLALDASVRTLDPEGTADRPLEGFFVGPGETVLRPEQLLLEVVVPRCEERSGSAFLRLARTATDIALVNVAVRVDLSASGVVTKARVALGAVAPTPMRAMQAERSLVGGRISEATARSAGKAAAAEAHPISDHRTTAEHRRIVAGVLVHRALLLAARRAQMPTS